MKRETGLRRLAREVVKLLQTGAGQDYTERQERGWRCCADMLAMMIEDKVTSLKEELEELIEEVKNEVDDRGANLPQIENCRVSRSINWTNPWTN